MVIINRILILMILLAVCVGSASAATSEGSAWGVNYWSDVDSSYDYSALYAINFKEVVQSDSNYTGYTMFATENTGNPDFYKYSVPTSVNIDFSMYDGLATISLVSDIVCTGLPADWGFTSSFDIEYDFYKVGGGSVSVWQDDLGYIHQYYSFMDMWNYSFTSTHQSFTVMDLNFTNNRFTEIPTYKLPIPYSGNNGKMFNTNTNTPNIFIGSTNARYDTYYGTWYYVYDDPIMYNGVVILTYDVVHNLYYSYNDVSGLGKIDLDRLVPPNDAAGTRLGISTDLIYDNNESNNTYSIFTNYNSSNISYTLGRDGGLLVDIYTTPALDYPTFTFILDAGGGGSSGSFADIVPIGSDPTFEYNITTDTAVYSPGDTVSVTYTTDRAGSLQVRDAVTNTVVHSKAFSAAVTNATWQFYIPTSDNYGYFDVYLLNTYGGVLDTVRYTLLPESNLTSFLHIVQPSINLFEEMDINVQAANESTFTLKDPNGIIVFNTTISAQTYSGLTYVPTVKTGTYTAYLYDVETLTDTIIVYAAVAPDIIDENATIIEDVMREDETMTEYFDDKFREFAPTAWGIFLLSILLWFMSILVSFGGSGSKRRR